MTQYHHSIKITEKRSRWTLMTLGTLMFVIVFFGGGGGGRGGAFEIEHLLCR